MKTTVKKSIFSLALMAAVATTCFTANAGTIAPSDTGKMSKMSKMDKMKKKKATKMSSDKMSTDKMSKMKKDSSKM